MKLARPSRIGLVQRMPRRLRVQYEDALYHVINRGNYRLPEFGSVGAARAFERTLGESAAPFRWIARRLHLGNLNTLPSNVRRGQQLHHALA